MHSLLVNSITLTANFSLQTSYSLENQSIFYSQLVEMQKMNSFCKKESDLLWRFPVFPKTISRGTHLPEKKNKKKPQTFTFIFCSSKFLLENYSSVKPSARGVTINFPQALSHPSRRELPVLPMVRSTHLRLSFNNKIGNSVCQNGLTQGICRAARGMCQSICTPLSEEKSSYSVDFSDVTPQSYGHYFSYNQLL